MLSFGRPRGAGDVAQSCSSQVEGGLPVRKCTDDTRAPSDLAQDALKRVVCADTPPVLLRESVLGQRLLGRHLNELGGSGEVQTAPIKAEPRSKMPASRPDV